MRPGALLLSDNASNSLLSVVVSGLGQAAIVAFTPGIITTIAGTGGDNFTADGTPATSAQIEPIGLAVDAAGLIYFSDNATNSQRIRTFMPGGALTTLAGGGAHLQWSPCPTGVDIQGDGCPALMARFMGPSGVTLGGDGTLYFADRNDHVVRKVQNGWVSLVAGSPGNFGFVDGQGTNAAFENPSALALGKSGELYVTDGNEIRRSRPMGPLPR